MDLSEDNGAYEGGVVFARFPYLRRSLLPLREDLEGHRGEYASSLGDVINSLELGFLELLMLDRYPPPPAV